MPSAHTDVSPFGRLIEIWNNQIKVAEDHKQEVWGQYAQECWDFYDGDHAFVFDESAAGQYASPFFGVREATAKPRTNFTPTINKAAEFEQLYAPMIYQKNPVPIIRPRQMAQIDPTLMGPMGMQMFQMMEMESQQQYMQAEMRGKLLESYITYSADELDLKRNARLCLTEGLVKGRGLLWIEIYQGPNQQQRVAGAFYDTVDNLLIDPDATQLSGAQWIARKRVMPWWEAEKKFQLPYGSLKKYAKAESHRERAKGRGQKDTNTRRKMGDTCDMLIFWEVYSKMGMGDRLKGKMADAYGEFAQTYAADNCYLAVCKDCPYFLNMPAELVETPGVDLASEVAARLSWPIPFWAENNGWPFVELDFHPHVTSPWPTPHLKPALGELYWMDWCASFLMEASTVSCRQFYAVVEEATEALTDTLTKGQCFDIIKFGSSNYKSINEMVQILQHQPISGELLNIYNLVSNNFDKRTGLMELVYGQTNTQLRSAQEANIKSEAMNVRPNDMAESMEHFMKRVHKHIALAARWMLVPETDIAPLMGQWHAMMWQQLIYSADVEAVVRELDYTVEAGSARKPNLAREQDQSNQALQIILPIAQTIYMSQGDPTLMNAVLGMWARSQEIDQTKFQLPPLMPQMPTAPVAA